MKLLQNEHEPSRTSGLVMRIHLPAHPDLLEGLHEGLTDDLLADLLEGLLAVPLCPSMPIFGMQDILPRTKRPEEL